jgi:Ca-activated chloride channel homolog
MEQPLEMAWQLQWHALKDSDAISRVVILLTDGENNSGEIAPLTAAEIARTFGIRVYTIGVGTVGTAPYPVQTPYGTQLRDIEVKIDEEMLQEIKHNRRKVFQGNQQYQTRRNLREIDQLEKSKIEVREFSRRSEEFLPFALAGILLLVLGLFLRTTVFRSIP